MLPSSEHVKAMDSIRDDYDKPEVYCECKYPARWVPVDKECAYCNKVIQDQEDEAADI